MVGFIKKHIDSIFLKDVGNFYNDPKIKTRLQDEEKEIEKISIDNLPEISTFLYKKVKKN